MNSTTTTTTRRTTQGEAGRAHAVCAIHGIPHTRLSNRVPAEGGLSPRQALRQDAIVLAGHECPYCGSELRTEASEGEQGFAEADRFVDGCTYNAGNVVPACYDCNRTRSDKHPLSVAKDPARLAKYVRAMLAKGATLRDPKGYATEQRAAAAAMLAEIEAAC